MSEEKKNELLEAQENKEKEEGGEKPQSQFSSVSLPLMILIVLGIIATGCWYTYYQYKRMEEINSTK